MAQAAPAPVAETITIAAGAYFEETIYPPSDRSPWLLSATAINGSAPFDVYIVATTDLIGAYPGGAFEPLVAREETTSADIEFDPPSRFNSYTLIIDNMDNARPGDALGTQAIEVHLIRTPPLRSNPEAQALLSSGASVCAAILLAAAVAVAVYLKRRPRPDTAGELDEDQARIEVDVEIPKPPRGAWARAAPDEPTSEPTGGPIGEPPNEEAAK
jgi:hypothetical protein